MTTEGLTYTQYLSSISNPEARQAFIKLSDAVTAGEITPAQFASQIEGLTGKTVTIHRSAGGNVLGYTLNNVSTVSNPNSFNSNVSTIARGNVSMPVSTGIDGVTGKATASRLVGVGTKVATGAALVGTAAMCVSAGITLGKTFDSVLYNLNPDFWDSHNMSTLNPETWSSITAGDDSLGASLLNVIFGFDSNGEGQAYIDENALAYMAAYMHDKGVFATAGGNISSKGDFENVLTMINTPISFIQDSFSVTSISTQAGLTEPNRYRFNAANNSVYMCDVFGAFTNGFGVIMASTSPFLATSITAQSPHYTPVPNTNASLVTVNGLSFYLYTSYTTGNNVHIFDSTIPINNVTSAINSEAAKAIGYLMIANGISPAIDGIGNQTGATLPDTSNWGDYSNILPSLQQQYPDLWNNAINYPVMQDDGTIKNYTYVPVAMPDFSNRTDTQPTTGNTTQTDPEINPNTLPQELIDVLTDILTAPYPKTSEDIDNPTPPANPTDTGDGNSPPITAPTGSASSLWAIYHPSQSEIDSFGAWLWSSNFIDQILKIFNNPMEAIIGLHKVYATPVDAGTTTIKVGYLDSQVSSAYIEQQYIEVDCGTVNLGEQFGNVFDYSPYTDVQLYLPFVGIVPLNVADVMRSSINVTYGVDVITGACLAMVTVSRDIGEAVLYQYSGNCAVQYPVSSGSYMGIVSSIIGVAGGIAATAATGGGAAPIVMGAAGAAFNAHTSIQRSGSFSGNSGAMGGKIPYIIISRPQTKLAENFDVMQGYPTNAYTTVGNCSGYIKAIAAHVINVNATDDELTLINDYLLGGIII